MATYSDSITRVDFGILSQVVIKTTSAATLNDPGSLKNDIPIEGGVYDAKLGTTSNQYDCKTCHLSKGDCRGHQGMIDLVYPVKNVIQIRIILAWLRVVCFECGNLLINSNRKRKLIAMAQDISGRNNKKDVKCVCCGALHPNVLRDQKVNTLMILKQLNYPDKAEQARYKVMYNYEIRDIFSRVPDTLIERFGTDPKSLIFTYLPISSTIIRPDTKIKSDEKYGTSESTSNIKHIIEINRKLENPEKIREILDKAPTSNGKGGYFTTKDTHLRDTIRRCVMLESEYVNGMIAGGNANKLVSRPSQANVENSYKEELSKKHGHIRRRMMGKRVHNTSRGVIVGDPTIAPDEFGFPLWSAKIHFVKTIVQNYNKDKLSAMFHSKVYPKIMTVKRGDSNPYARNPETGEFKLFSDLQIGDIVERQLIDGDMIYVNRQPTLHKPSMSGMRVRVIPGNVFRLNPVSCAPFNADFDGDQMNSIINATIEAAVECKMIGSIDNWLISEQTSNPIMGVFQDGIVGIFKLTRSDIKINRYTAMLLFGEVDINVRLTKDYYTGRELASILLQQFDINFVKTPAWYSRKEFEPYVKYDPSETKLVIEKGIIKQGVLDKKSVGQGVPGSIIHEVAMDSFANALKLIHQFQMLTDKFLSMRGITVSLNDMMVSDDAKKDLSAITQNIIADALANVEKLDNGKIIPPIGMSVMDAYEMEQMATLKLDDDFQEKVIEGLGKNINNNDLFQLVMCGSKGKLGNIIAMSSALGQQVMNGGRMMTNFGFKRSLPYFTRFDENPKSRGYVESAYMDGMQVDEFIFAAMTARFAIAQRALSTATVGTFSRQAIKSMESVTTDFNRFSRINKRVTQFLYGDDGFKVNELKQVKFNTVKLGDKLLKENYLMTDSIAKKIKEIYNKKLCEDEYAQLKKDRDEYRKVFMHLEKMHPSKAYLFKDELYMPVDIVIIRTNVLSDYPDRKTSKEPLSLMQSIALVNDYCDNVGKIYFNKNVKKEIIKTDIYNGSCTLLRMLIRSYLCSRELVRYHITIDILKEILKRVHAKLLKSLVSYGDSVGILAVHSVAQSVMQYILDSHHRTGFAGEEEIPFMKQVDNIMMAKEFDPKKKGHINNVVTYIGVPDKIKGNKSEVSRIANHIGSIKLSSLLSDKIQIFRTVKSKIIHPDYLSYNKIIDLYKKRSPLEFPKGLRNYVIVFSLDHNVLIEKYLETHRIAEHIMTEYPESFVICNDIGSDNVLLFVFTLDNKMQSQLDIKKWAIELESTIVRGTPYMVSAKAEEILRTGVDNDGNVTNEKQKEYIIKTYGINFPELLINPYIDQNSIYTTSITEIEKYFGIEAARRAIINEMRCTFEDIQTKHYTVFADAMTCTGKVTAIRNGAPKREPNNLLLHVSEAYIMRNLIKGSSGNVSNPLYGASAPLMMGQVPKIGTLYSDIYMDHDYINSSIENVDDVVDSLLDF